MAMASRCTISTHEQLASVQPFVFPFLVSNVQCTWWQYSDHFSSYPNGLCEIGKWLWTIDNIMSSRSSGRNGFVLLAIPNTPTVVK